MELITVIVPIYNVEKYLKECVQSIINQTYKNLEIILVDDGSPDKCPQMCDEFAKMDERIRVIHKENGGLSDARNAGLNIAKGEYVTFVDSDDFILQDMIEKLYTLCKEYKAEISMCQCVKCSEDGIYQMIQPREEKKVFEKQQKMYAYLKTNQIETTAWKKLYSKRLFEDLRFPKGKIHEDAFTTYLLVDKADRIAITNRIGYVYRTNSESITNARFSEKKFDSIEAKLNQLCYIEHKYPDLYQCACTEVIYACNYCLKGMSLDKYRNKEREAELQNLYKKYTYYYLVAHNVSFKGKVVVAIAYFDIKFAQKLIKLIYKAKNK